MRSPSWISSGFFSESWSRSRCSAGDSFCGSKRIAAVRALAVGVCDAPGRIVLPRAEKEMEARAVMVGGYLAAGVGSGLLDGGDDRLVLGRSAEHTSEIQ